jgi:cytochrome bd-type quinol oxidase subunit 1
MDRRPTSCLEDLSMTAVWFARLPFAFTTSVHIIFPAFTIGLSAFTATPLILWRHTEGEHYHPGAARRDLACS